MIIGIGTDIVRIERFEQMLARHGGRIATRILAAEELTLFAQANKPALYLAKRFAAKEAAAKAFGTGFRDGLSLRHIAVRSDPLGKPLLEFSGRAAELATQQGVCAAHLSLSDERDYAVAFVVLSG